MTSNLYDGTVVLVVDDEPDVYELIKATLEPKGFLVFGAEDGESAISEALKLRPDVIVLDVMLPGESGIEICRKLRRLKQFKDTPIIMLTAKGDERSEIEGLQAGADDYVVKPIRLRALEERIKSVLRRKGKEHFQHDNITYGNLTIDFQQKKVFIGNTEIILTPREFELLKVLALEPGRVFSREELFLKVWRGRYVPGDRSVDVYMRKLRIKLGDKYFITRKGFGYAFQVPQED